MNFLRKSKLKIKIDKMGEEVKFTVEYFKLKDSESFKEKLLKSIIDLGACLAVINTKFMYSEQNKNYGNYLNTLIEQFEELGIKYKKVVVKKTKNVSVFGIPIKQNNEKKYEDYVIGFIAGKDDIESIIPKLSFFNVQYYIDYDKLGEDELLSRFESNYDEEEELKLNFKFSIFEDNFVKQVVIYSMEEDSESIRDILENLNSDL